MIMGKIRTERLQRIIREFPRETEAEMDDFLTNNVRVLISSSGKVPGLVQVTPPFHKGVEGKAAQTHGQAKVKGDIKQVFASASYAFKMIAAKSPIMAEVFWRHLKRREFVKAQAVLSKYSSNVRLRGAAVVSAPDVTLHEKARGKNTGAVPKNRHVAQVIANEGKLNSYIRKKQSRVGYLASSIPVAVGGQFGNLRGVPAWVMKQKSRLGYVKRRKSGQKKSVTLGINSGAYGVQRRFDTVIGYRLAAMERELPVIASKLEKKLRARLS
jgi:hypothetical protein